MTSFARELPFGATLIEDGRTRFRLWAPRQEQVSLQIEERDPAPMRRLPGGWFEAEAAVRRGDAISLRARFGTGRA